MPTLAHISSVGRSKPPLKKEWKDKEVIPLSCVSESASTKFDLTLIVFNTGVVLNRKWW